MLFSQLQPVLLDAISGSWVTWTAGVTWLFSTADVAGQPMGVQEKLLRMLIQQACAPSSFCTQQLQPENFISAKMSFCCQKPQLPQHTSEEESP